MVSHRTPTYFHSRDDTYARQSESTHIHHVDIPATSRTPTISLLSTRSLVMPVVSLHSVSLLIHQSKDMNRDQGYYYQLVSFPDQKLAISPHRPHRQETIIYFCYLTSQFSYNSYSHKYIVPSHVVLKQILYHPHIHIPSFQPEQLRQSLSRPLTQYHYYIPIYKPLPEVLELHILVIFSCIYIYLYLCQSSRTRGIDDSWWIT